MRRMINLKDKVKTIVVNKDMWNAEEDAYVAYVNSYGEGPQKIAIKLAEDMPDDAYVTLRFNQPLIIFWDETYVTGVDYLVSGYAFEDSEDGWDAAIGFAGAYKNGYSLWIFDGLCYISLLDKEI